MGKYVEIPWKHQHLAAIIDYPASIDNTQKEKRFPLVIICHGFTSSRIGVDRLFVKTGQALTIDGCAVLRFDYEGCGESPGFYGGSGMDEWIEQTKAVIGFALNLGNIDPDRIFLLGHSLGGATALLTATDDCRVNKLILWSAVAHPFGDIGKIVGWDKLKGLKKNHEIDHLGYTFKAKFFDSLEKYEPLVHAPKFLGDVLLVHGTHDDEIPFDYNFDYEQAFFNRECGTCEKKAIEGANHTFSTGIHFQELITCTRKWILEKAGIYAESMPG